MGRLERGKGLAAPTLPAGSKTFSVRPPRGVECILTAEHRVDLKPAARRPGMDEWSYLGVVRGVSREPLFAAARWLLEQGLASPGDRIVDYRGGLGCLSAKVGVAAGLTVAEPSKGGIRFARYKAWEPA